MSDTENDDIPMAQCGACNSIVVPWIANHAPSVGLASAVLLKNNLENVEHVVQLFQLIVNLVLNVALHSWSMKPMLFEYISDDIPQQADDSTDEITKN